MCSFLLRKATNWVSGVGTGHFLTDDLMNCSSYMSDDMFYVELSCDQHFVYSWVTQGPCDSSTALHLQGHQLLIKRSLQATKLQEVASLHILLMPIITCFLMLWDSKHVDHLCFVVSPSLPGNASPSPNHPTANTPPPSPMRNSSGVPSPQPSSPLGPPPPSPDLPGPAPFAR